MAKNKHHECIECDAVFKIKHDLEENHYKVEFCPFCGSAIEEVDEEQYEDLDNEDEDLS
jgi:rRNA maturation endonuclease Nob1